MRELTLLTVCGLLLLAACGQEPGDGGDGDGAGDDEGGGAATSLRIEVVADEDAEPTVMNLECDPTGGDHPNAEAACEALSAAGPEVFEPVPLNRMCSMIYGGPQTATITGTLDGEQVDASFDREGGCEIARWDALGTEVFDIPLQ